MVHLSFTRGLSTSIQLETQRATRPHLDCLHPSSYGLWCISLFASLVPHGPLGLDEPCGAAMADCVGSP